MSQDTTESRATAATEMAGGWGRDLLLLVLAFGLLWGLALNARAFWGPDEGRYVEIPREMVSTGDYVTPRLNGVKYFEKPPLFYWLETGAIHLFGIEEWAMRLVPALFAILGCLGVYAAGRRLFGRRAGLLAAGVLATNPFYYFMGNAITLDMTVSVLLSLALLAFLVAVGEPEGPRRRNLLWAFYVLLALATLTKGLIGIVIPGMIVVAWMAVAGEWRQLLRMRLISGTVLFLLVAVPWHVLVAQRNSEFLYFYFVHEHFLRYTTKIHDRYEPPWFFVPVLLGGLIPWTAFLLQAVRGALPAGWRRRREKAPELFLLLWAALVFVFFSLSDSKLVPYILPVLPPLALLIGRYLSAIWEKDGRELRLASAVLLVLGAGLGLALGLAPWYLHDPKVMRYIGLLGGRLGLLAGSLVLLGVIPFLFTRKGRPDRALAAILGSAVLFLLAMVSCLPVFNVERSTRDLALWLKPRLQPADRVVNYRTYDQELPVYLQRRITIAGWLGELEMGAKAEDTSAWMVDLPTFERIWRGPETVYLVTYDKRFEKLLATGLPLRVIARSGDNVVAVNR